MPKAPKPQLVSANDLLEGHVLYLGKNGVWTTSRHEAAVSTDKDELDALAAKASETRQVVDVAHVEVTLEDGGPPRPVALREVIRDRGPTNRPDLGRQADPTLLQTGADAEGTAHV